MQNFFFNFDLLYSFTEFFFKYKNRDVLNFLLETCMLRIERDQKRKCFENFIQLQ